MQPEAGNFIRFLSGRKALLNTGCFAGSLAILCSFSSIGSSWMLPRRCLLLLYWPGDSKNFGMVKEKLSVFFETLKVR